MRAFEKIQSGLPEMDRAFDSIRLGDNVVLQVGSLEEFKLFAVPFARQAAADGRRLLYIRFASHPPLIEDIPGLEVRTVELSHQFETFTMEIRRIIEEAGREAFYVFDCLSELQTAWSTDMMMGNFFRVTCPYLFELDTVAFFPILRGCHSFAAVAKIRDTTQILLDVFSEHQWETVPQSVYVHPLKVWKRYSPTMFLPHRYDVKTGEFRPLTDGVSASRFYAILNEEGGEQKEQTLDSWDRLFIDVQNRQKTGDVSRSDLRTLCRIMMSRDKKLQPLIDRHFTLEDYMAVRSRMIGTGLIGGKACGMLLARKIACAGLSEEDVAHFEPHDSYFIGSDVFYTYIVANNCWNLRVHQRTEQGYFMEAPKLGEALLSGTFPDDIREEFKRLLDYFGQSPIIVRSSSILEDGYGNAFAGKYDSVFCDNTGTPEERLTAFENAVRRVYASTMNRSALEYRVKRGLSRRDEQMALLVQRVSGSYYGKIFMPDAAGVGYSFSLYKFREEMDVKAGMLRLVMGLGTRAVDRTGEDYPRLVSLDAPTVQLQATVAERHRYSQHRIDVIALPGGESHTSLEKIRADLPDYVVRTLTEHDSDAERRFRERGQNRDVLYVSCAGLLENEAFTGMMKRLLHLLQSAYDYPVDIEFTVNIASDGAFVVNLLQCRPLQLYLTDEKVEVPRPADDRIYLRLKGASMGRSIKMPVDWVVYVDPRAYYTCPYVRKSEVSRIVEKINRRGGERGRQMVLFAPGRIGTSSPELGIPVAFADICDFRAICEVAYSEVGYMPELSYGSHMFQDLVESDILYGAVFENEKTRKFDPDFMKDQHYENRFGEICPESGDFSDMIYVYDTRESGLTLYHDAVKGELLIAR